MKEDGGVCDQCALLGGGGGGLEAREKWVEGAERVDQCWRRVGPRA